MSERRLSERARFYLEHRRQIEEWAGLHSTLHDEVHEFFASLREPLEMQAEDLAGSPRVFAHFERTEPPKLFLTHSNWIEDEEGAHPRLGIGFEWRKKPEFDNGYVGIWTNKAAYPLLSQMFVDSAADEILPLAETSTCSPSDGGWSAGRSAWWPIWRYGKPRAGPVWENLEDFADQIVHDITVLWSASWRVVDAHHSEWLRSRAE